jgi:iron complex outermembrane receptor protein
MLVPGGFMDISRRSVPCSRVGVATAMLLLGVPTIVFAQSATDESPARLEEIIVTAQKREQNLQSVGVSVTALDAQALAQMNFKDLTDVASQVPGLQYNQCGATVTIYNIRGVSQNDFTDHQEAPVAVYSDDAYIASTGALSGALFDLQRVEVLRGPQGTLFGRNATGGLIQYISQKPTDTDEGYFTVTAGNYGTVETEGAISGPLKDGIDGRLSFATNYHEGYLDNTLGHSLDNQNQAALRGQLLFKLDDGGQILVKLHGENNDHETSGNYSWVATSPNAQGRGYLVPPTFTGDCPQLNGGCVPGADLSGYRNPSSDPFTQSVGDPGYFNRTVWGSTIHFTDKIGDVSVTSVTDFLHLQKRYSESSDPEPVSIFDYIVYQNYQQFSEELRFNGEMHDFRWIGGVYFLDYHTNDLNAVELAPVLGGNSFAAYGLRTTSTAVFGQVEYDIASQWTLIAGARYTYDDKKFNLNYEPQGLIYDPAHYPSAARTFDIPTGKLELDYKPLNDLLFYASVNWGAKGGGWSAVTSGVANPSQLPYNTERLTSYEGGFKSTFWDGAARLNGSIFHYHYDDYQGFFLNGLTQVVENKNARVDGGELELSVIPTRGLNLQLGASNLSSEAFDIPLPAGGYTTTELPQAPRWSLNAEARYEWPAFGGGKLSLEGDTKWNTRQYMELLNNPDDLQPSYAVTNGSLTYTTAGGAWEVGAYVKNIADKVYEVYFLDLSSLYFAQRVLGPPRTYGATVTFHWGK